MGELLAALRAAFQPGQGGVSATPAGGGSGVGGSNGWRGDAGMGQPSAGLASALPKPPTSAAVTDPMTWLACKSLES